MWETVAFEHERRTPPFPTLQAATYPALVSGRAPDPPGDVSVPGGRAPLPAAPAQRCPASVCVTLHQAAHGGKEAAQSLWKSFGHQA